jgi:hypothetical protein
LHPQNASQMSPDAVAAALCDLVLGEETRRRSAFLVGLLGELFHISLMMDRCNSVSSSSSHAASIEVVVFMPGLPRTGWLCRTFALADPILKLSAFLRAQSDNVFLDGSLIPRHESPPAPCRHRDSKNDVSFNDASR